MPLGFAGAIGSVDLQGCLSRLFVYIGIHINAKIHGFPADYHTVAWSMFFILVASSSNVIANQCYMVDPFQPVSVKVACHSS